MSIEISNLTKIYGDQKAVDAISFTVGKGEIVGFLGPNGAGKSTTMKIITGYLGQDGGEAIVCGLSVRQQPLETKKKDRVPTRGQSPLPGYVCAGIPGFYRRRP